MDIEKLEWDTDFFQTPVYRISNPTLSKAHLQEQLSKALKLGASLVYWQSGKELSELDSLPMKGSLVDLKATFLTNLATTKGKRYSSLVETYHPSMKVEELIDLAVQSGEYSRFSVDPNIDLEKFHELYSIWARRSAAKEIALEVFVIRSNTKIVAMLTAGTKNGIADIGLLAVDSSVRGQGHGQTLVRHAQQWFQDRGFKQCQVVTQKNNLSACGLYQKCEFQIQKIEPFYHFWKKPSTSA